MKLRGKDAAAKKAAAAEAAADDEPACLECGKEGGLKRCAKCREACYCSRECQVAHWRVHKKACGKGLRKDKMDAHEYYNHVAHTDAAAKELAASVDLQLASDTEEGLA